MINITDVRFFNLESNSKMLALASITIDGCFVVQGFKIMQGKNGLWVGNPSQKSSNGEYKDIAFAIKPEARKNISETILSKYNNQDQKQPTSNVPNGSNDDMVF